MRRIQIALSLAAVLTAQGASAQQLPGSAPLPGSQTPPPPAAAAPAPPPANAAQPATPGAQPADPAAKAFETYLNSKDYQARIAKLLAMEEKSIAPECKAAKLKGRLAFDVLRPPTFQGGPHPATGAWRERIGVDRCGKLVLHNLIAMAQPATEPQIGLLFPGVTVATPPLQREAISAAGAEAITKLGCKDHTVSVTDTFANEILEPLKASPTGLIVGGQWSEIWNIRACKKVLPVSVLFTADGKGGAKVEATVKADAAKKTDAGKTDSGKPAKK